MNSVSIIGRLTKDPEVRWSNGQEPMAITTFTVAIDRGRDRNGNDKGADFPRVTVFGRMAENCEKYLSKGRQVGIQGHIQTGSYDDRNGNKVYTTDVIADRVYFIGDNGQQSQQQAQGYTQQAGQRQTQYQQPTQGQRYEPVQQTQAQYQAQSQMPMGFEGIQDDDIPF